MSEALISDCTEEETKGFTMARRALVCSYLTRLQSFREKVQERKWAEGFSSYKAMTLSLFREYFDTVTHLLFLSGDNLNNAVIGHSKWAKENVLPVVQMLMTAFSDDNVSVPMLFEHFPEAGETFLSFQSALGNVSKDKPKQQIKEEKVEGAAAFFPGMSSTLMETQSPSAKKDLHRQQRMNAVFENEGLTPQQKQFMMENIMNEEEEEGSGMHLNPAEEDEEEDPLSKGFQLHLDVTDHELYSAPQPYSRQYHSLPDVK